MDSREEPDPLAQRLGLEQEDTAPNGSEADSGDFRYCPYCGADIPDGAVSFCAECGKALPVKKEKPEKSTPVKKSSAGKKKKHKSTVMTDAELRKAYNDGYDGYYEDLLPVDHGRERFETDSAPVKKIIILAAGVLVVIGLCVLMLYFV